MFSPAVSRSSPQPFKVLATLSTGIPSSSAFFLILSSTSLLIPTDSAASSDFDFASRAIPSHQASTEPSDSSIAGSRTVFVSGSQIPPRYEFLVSFSSPFSALAVYEFAHAFPASSPVSSRKSVNFFVPDSIPSVTPLTASCP